MSFTRLVLTLFVVVAAPRSALADAQLWTEGGIGFDVTKRLTLGASQSLRFDNDVSQLKSAFLQTKLRFAVNKFVRVGGGYRYYMDRGGVRAQRGFLNLDLRYRKKKAPWRLGFRSQLQSTLPENGTSIDYWRNRAGGSYAVSKNVSPFVSLELFYATDQSEFRRYRIMAGASVDVARHWSVEAAYVFQSDINQNNPERDHVLSLELSYAFDR